MRAVVVVVAPGREVEARTWEALIALATSQGHRVVALMRDATMAVAVVSLGFADLVVAADADPAGVLAGTRQRVELLSGGDR